MVCAHKKEHHDACTDGTYAVDTTDPNKPLTLTSDNDRLDNTCEDNHYFGSTSSNTPLAPAYGNETDAPDDEAIADIVGLGTLLGLLDDSKQGWAGAAIKGVQFGKTHLAIKPGILIPLPLLYLRRSLKNGRAAFDALFGVLSISGDPERVLSKHFERVLRAWRQTKLPHPSDLDAISTTARSMRSGHCSFGGFWRALDKQQRR